MKQILSLNEKIEDYSPNYLACICRIDNSRPIENADNLKMTTVNGHDIVISKDFKEGDIVVYFPCETSISEKYLSANNLYEIGEYDKNSNASIIEPLKKSADACKLNGEVDKYEELISTIKKQCGFFNKYGRVRILKLRGVYSDGFIAKVDSIERAYPNIDFDWESQIDKQFNEINGELFCWKFIPPIKEVRHSGTSERKWKKIQKNFEKFDRIIPGMFIGHFDTVKIEERMGKGDLSPEDYINVSVKIHGTSFVIGNIPCKRKLNWIEKIKKFFGIEVDETEYDVIYSSHKVIQNKYINPNHTTFYPSNIYTSVYNVIKDFIPRDMTVYGEIAGYCEGSNAMIQKNHDYGCKPGEWKFMPYRITTRQEDGKFFEWNVNDVYEWTLDLVAKHPEITDKIMPLTIVYSGKFKDMYPDISTEQHWHENVLQRLKTDKDWLLMECDEPLCKYHKVPREGYVFRIDNDAYPRAWKLKTMRHYDLARKQHDAGEVDMEEIN